eukprot:UN4189
MRRVKAVQLLPQLWPARTNDSATPASPLRTPAHCGTPCGLWVKPPVKQLEQVQVL